MTREEHTQIFADRLNMLKNDHDLTYRDIERKTGIRHNQLAEWAKGKTVANGYAIFRLSEFFGVSADWLLGLSNDMGRTST